MVFCCDCLLNLIKCFQLISLNKGGAYLEQSKDDFYVAGEIASLVCGE